jgi:dephospho-CoA kinase
VLSAGSDGFASVLGAFGSTVLSADGSLDRAKLADVAFAHEEARRALEAITHPLIAEASKARFQEAEHAGQPLACYEASLLIERDRADGFRPLVVVVAPEAEQIRRAMARGRMDEARVRARMSAQLPSAAKARMADWVIENDGDLAELEERADRVLDEVCHTVGIDPARFPRALDRTG